MMVWRVIFLVVMLAGDLLAQCSMCAKNAAGQNAGVLNAGILMLLVPTLAILTGILVTAYRRSG